MKFNDPETTLVFAFRYALDRETLAADYVIKDIIDNWEHISINTRAQIVREIMNHFDFGGSVKNTKKWNEVIRLSRDVTINEILS